MEQSQTPTIETEKKPSVWKKLITGKEGEFKFLAPTYVCFGEQKTPKVYDYGKARCYTKKGLHLFRWILGLVVLAAFIVFLFSMIIDIDYIVTGIMVIIAVIGLVIWIIVIIIDRVAKEENIYRNLIIIGVVVVIVWVTLYFLFRS